MKAAQRSARHKAKTPESDMKPKKRKLTVDVGGAMPNKAKIGDKIMKINQAMSSSKNESKTD